MYACVYVFMYWIDGYFQCSTEVQKGYHTAFPNISYTIFKGFQHAVFYKPKVFLKKTITCVVIFVWYLN